MLRLGLCCIFKNEPIKFRQTTAKTLKQFDRAEQVHLLSELCLHNVQTIQLALRYVNDHNIGAFRILSPLFPRYTHPEVAYKIDELPQQGEIVEVCAAIRKFSRQNDIRLSLHPDQFNVLSSPRIEVVKNTIRELEYQGVLADMLGAEVINIHAGGQYGNKKEALKRLKENFKHLSRGVKAKLTLENDDVSYGPQDLLPVCSDLSIPFVYDIHHHRCLPDELSEEEATQQSIALWQSFGREPYFHLSSPKFGWHSKKPKPHADYINPIDFPSFWLGLDISVDIEAKAKELAVLQLQRDLDL